MFRTGAQLMILTLLVGLFLMRESTREPVATIDESFADFLAMNAKRSEQSAPVTLVQINDSTLRQHPLPWTPLDYAVFFQSALGFRPESLATDEILAWDVKTMSSEQAEKITQFGQMLREQVLQSPRVLLGARLGFPEDPDRLPELEPIPVLRKVRGDVATIPEFTVIEARAAEDYRLSSREGFTNLPGANNWHRSVPLLFRYRGEVVPSFVLQALILWEKVSLDDIHVELGSRVALGDRVDIPIDSAGRMRVDFGAIKGRCGLDDLILAAEQRDAGGQSNTPPELFAGRLLLLSRADPPAQNLRLASGRRGTSGELFASAIATIQARSFIRRAPWWSDYIIIGGYALMGLWIPRWSRGLTMFIGIFSLLAYTLVALGIFGANLIWISGVIPLGLVLFLVLYRLVSPTIDPWATPPKR
jgi:hypothetical protein